ncbi:MAG: amidohydrolase [Acidimicrobiia bacterium]|nr:amidohydrolase [Acidimicrobiia bacterium]
MGFTFPIISADSHITEPADTYLMYIDPAWRDRAPRVTHDETRGDLFVVEGMKSIPMGLVAAAGRRPEEIKADGRYEDMHRSGWDSSVRLADQARDGISAEVLYPTVGMVLCNLADLDYKKACFDAYNRWIVDYCAIAPERLLGVGQTAARTVDEAIADLGAITAAGLRGVMMPGLPGEADYDDPVWDRFWAAAAESGLPLSFHILTTATARTRGSRLNSFLAIVRGIQDIMSLLVFGGVFERHPGLRVVCVEADAGWVPHFMYRMDHAYNRHRHHLAPGTELVRLPSEYFAEHIWVTFQDDWTAFRFADDMNWRRLMWANDFPHSDSTWPWSQQLLNEQTVALSDEQCRAILSGNCAALYGIDVDALPALAA